MGFTEHQVRKIIVRKPTILSIKVDQRLKPKIEMMGSELGLTVDVLCRISRLLINSLEKGLIPNSNIFNLFASKANLTMALIRAALFLLYDIERKMKPNVDLLQQSGVEGELLLFLISRSPSILSQSANSLKFKIIM